MDWWLTAIVVPLIGMLVWFVIEVRAWEKRWDYDTIHLEAGCYPTYDEHHPTRCPG